MLNWLLKLSYVSTEPSDNLRVVSLLYLFPVWRLLIMWRVLLPSKPLLIPKAGNFDTGWAGFTLMTGEDLIVFTVRLGLSRWSAFYSLGCWRPIGVWSRCCLSSHPFFIPSEKAHLMVSVILTSANFFCSSRAWKMMIHSISLLKLMLSSVVLSFTIHSLNGCKGGNVSDNTWWLLYQSPAT